MGYKLTYSMCVVVHSDTSCCTRLTHEPAGTLPWPATTCFSATVPFEKESFKITVTKGADYFLMMHNPGDPKALVAFCPCVERTTGRL